MRNPYQCVMIDVIVHLGASVAPQLGGSLRAGRVFTILLRAWISSLFRNFSLLLREAGIVV